MIYFGYVSNLWLKWSVAILEANISALLPFRTGESIKARGRMFQFPTPTRYLNHQRQPMVTIRRSCTLSAFNRSTRSWAPIPLRNAQSQMMQTSQNIDALRTLSLISWNIDAFSPRPVSRAKLILDHILEAPKSPDIIFLQEVTPDVRASLMDNARVRAAFLGTDVEDQTSFEDVPFATITLLSREHFAPGPDSQKEGDGVEGGERFIPGGVSRVTLPSKYRRDALYVDIISPTVPGTVFRLINVHLDSLGDTLHYRAQ